MALNAEQIFIDALGREPTADELQDIRLNLWMLTRAGFAVDDPSNAPLIAPWAWMWGRIPRSDQSRAAPAAASPQVAECSPEATGTIEALLREIPAKIDPSVIAAAIAERMPPLIVRHRIDGSAFASALRESFTLIWIGLAAFGICLAGVLGWHFGAWHESATLAARVAHQAEPLHPPPVIEGQPRARRRP